MTRFFLPLLITLLLVGCGGSESVPAEETREIVVARYADSTRRVVNVMQGDSVVERRQYRPTGSVLRIERGDSVLTYFDIHDPDSSFVLADFMQGRWRNVSVDTTDPDASASYVFGKDSLTFRSPSDEPIETISIEYENFQTLRTGDGMPVSTEIVGFDTIRVTGYTLVRRGL